MKKLTVILLAALMLAAMMALPTSAADAAYTVPCDIVISGLLANPNTVPYDGPASTKDFVEYMELVNVSDHDVDLYDYTFYYVNKPTEEELLAAAAEGKFSKRNNFATAPGQYVLKPGQFALIWFISQECYDYIDSHCAITIVDNKPVYNVEKYWSIISSFAFDFCGHDVPATVADINGFIITHDISTAYGIGSTEFFNIANPNASKSIGIFACERDMPVETYLTASIIPPTTLSADVEYCYDLSDGKVLKLVNDLLYDITPTKLHPTQVNIAAEIGVTFETTAEETTTPAPVVTTPEPEETTTPAPEPEETTPAPEAVETTPAPTPAETTPAPTPDDKKEGCGSVLALPLVAVIALPACLIGKKKRK